MESATESATEQAIAIATGASPPVAFGGGEEGAEDEEDPPTMSLEEATAGVARMGTEGCDALGARALGALLRHLSDEAGHEHPNAKFLPPAQRWCSKNLSALDLALRVAPRAAPHRFGRHRLFVVQIVGCLVRAQRPMLNTALSATKPSLLRACLQHGVDAATPPTASILHVAVHELLCAVLSGPNKPLRLAMLAPPKDALPPAAAAL